MRYLLLLLAALPASLAAQQQQQFTFGGVGATEIVQSRSDLGDNRFTGVVLGGEGTFTSDRFIVRLRYAQGRVNASQDNLLGPETLQRDVVEGSAFVGYRAVQWLTLWAGPTAWAHTTDGKDQRWLFWVAGASARGTLIPARMQTFVELWGALSGNVTTISTPAGGRGANAGLEMRLGQSSPLWGRLAYRIESGHAEDLRETVEAVTLSVIFGIPQ
jgi:hypothetical protein